MKTTTVGMLTSEMQKTKRKTAQVSMAVPMTVMILKVPVAMMEITRMSTAMVISQMNHRKRILAVMSLLVVPTATMLAAKMVPIVMNQTNNCNSQRTAMETQTMILAQTI